MDACFASLEEGRGINYIFKEEVLTSIEILGSDYSGNAEALSRLLGNNREQDLAYVSEVDFPALCELDHDGTTVAKAAEALRGRKRRMFFTTQIHLDCRVRSADRIMKRTRRYLRLADFLSPPIEPIARPIINRLRQDQALVDLMWGRLTSQSATISEKMSFSRMLAAARGLTTELRAWCEDELERYSSTTFVPVGIDVLARTTRPITWSLLEMLL